MVTLTDSLGNITLDKTQYYGPFTARSLDNFNVSDDTVSLELIYAYVEIKQCAAKTNHELGYLDDSKAKAIFQACDDILSGMYDQSFVVNKYQGGAGTSTNMNVNEVIANVALIYLGHDLHMYENCHPIDDVNMHQSTNDTYPTALKIASIRLVRELADELSLLQEAFQRKETEYANILKLSRTQMMDAVPILASQMFSAYADVTSRDRWRIYKAEERLRYINIGGTAIGTGINAPITYGFKMLARLKQATHIGLAEVII
ncbi:MAG: lyase family protein [Candidatus Izemoplasma sp.]|nr:lyase family protein [Candidatus Izemoplasma sp.]